jgi:hypothetical protein
MVLQCTQKFKRDWFLSVENAQHEQQWHEREVNALGAVQQRLHTSVHRVSIETGRFLCDDGLYPYHIQKVQYFYQEFMPTMYNFADGA